VIRLRATFLLLVCLALTACSSPQAVIPSSTPSTTPTASSTPTEQPTSSPTAAVSKSTPTVGSDETSTPEVDQTYIPGTTKESDFPLSDTDQMWPLLCILEGIVVPETPIPYGETGYVITAYAEKCMFGNGKVIENMVLGIRNLGDGSEILVTTEPKTEGPFATTRLIEKTLENTGITEGRKVLVRFGYKNEANAVWLGTDDYAADIINAQLGLEEFALTGDPSALEGEWFIPAQLGAQISSQE